MAPAFTVWGCDMTATREIVSRAFRKIGVVSADTEIEAHEMQEGIDTLNMMLHEWKLSSVDTSHSDLTAGSEFPLDPEYEFGTVYMLAMHLSPTYEAPANFNADDFFRRIQAAYMTIDTVAMPKALTETAYKDETWLTS